MRRLCVLSMAAAILPAAPPKFAAREIATGLKGGSQVVAADLNGDGRPDLIALASGMPELVWYENPGWQRHAIAAGTGAPDYRGHTPLVYYRPGEWKRVLIGEETEGVMHGIHVVDWHGDGRDEILAGDRGKGGSAVWLLVAEDKAGARWRRHPPDVGGVAAASCAVVDLNADRRPDIACIGTSTANLRIYENSGH